MVKELKTAIRGSLLALWSYFWAGASSALLAVAYGGLVVLVPWYLNRRGWGNRPQWHIPGVPDSWGLLALWVIATSVALGMIITRHSAKKRTVGRKGNYVARATGRWNLVYEIVKNLGDNWEVTAAAAQELGQYAGLASGPGGMTLSFVARTENLDPCMERACPPLGWLRVDGRFQMNDGDLEAKLSMTLDARMPAKNIADELRTRLLPIYSDFRHAVAERGLEDNDVGAHSVEPFTERQRDESGCETEASGESKELKITDAGKSYITSPAYEMQMVAAVAQFWGPEKGLYDLLLNMTAMCLCESDPAKAGAAAFKRFVADNLPIIRAAIDRIKISQPAIKLSEENWERANLHFAAQTSLRERS